MKRLIIGVLVFLGISAAVFGANQGLSASDVDAAVAALKAAGQPVCAADLASNVPDAQNAALLYTQAAKVLSSSRSDIYKSSRLLDPGFRAKSPKMWTAARGMVARYSGTVNLIERASSMPQCRYPMDALHRPGFIDCPGYQDARLLTSFLSTAALVYARDGKTNDCVRCLTLAYKVAESLKDEPTSFGSVLRNMCHSTAALALQGALSTGKLDYTQANKLFELLRTIDFYPGYKNALIGERAILIESNERMRKAEAERPKQNGQAVKTPAAPSQTCAIEMNEIKMMQELIDRSNVPYREIVAGKLDHAPDFPTDLPFLTPMYTAYVRDAAVRDMNAAQISGERVLLALAAYHAKFHAYPKTLSDLKAKLHWKLPVDPFSGSDFKYRIAGKGFILYSIGANLKDDNGVQGKQGDDIVWKL